MFPRCSVNTWSAFGVSLAQIRSVAARLWHLNIFEIERHIERLMGGSPSDIYTSFSTLHIAWKHPQLLPVGLWLLNCHLFSHRIVQD
jgi:hypothetical protein